MRLTVTSPKVFILKSLEGQALALMRQEKQGISPTVEFGLAELARHEMRSLAQQGNGSYEEEELLELSIQQACDALQARVWAQDIRFDFEPYLPGLRNTLQYPAREIAELSGNRLKAKEHASVPNFFRPRSHNPILYEVFNVGRWQVASGMMARPLVDEFELELVQDSEEYQLEGDWFPFVLTREELEFIVNEDGTVFVAVMEPSGESSVTVLVRLLKVCELIYREANGTIFTEA